MSTQDPPCSHPKALGATAAAVANRGKQDPPGPIASPLQMISSPYLRRDFCCSICHERHNETLLPGCGHLLCSGCIGQGVEKQGGAELSKCPKCETPLNSAQKDQTRCKIAFNFICAPQDDDNKAILFTCNQSPIPTIKFCPQDGVSLCVDHLMALSKSPGHDQPNTRRCPDHTRPQTFYCVDDDDNVCALCISRHHRGHQVESVYEASMKKKELSSPKSEVKDRNQGLEKRRMEASSLATKVSLLFHDLRKHLEVLEKKVLGKVLRQVEQVSAPCHDQIPSKKDEAKPMAYIKELCISSNSSTFLKGKEPEDVGAATFQETGETHHLEAALILHKHKTELLSADCNGCFMNREADILLDEDTAGNNIQILHRMGLSCIRWKEDHKPKPKTPQRFKDHQVLSSTIFSKGRHFWTLETSKWGNWRFGMAYPSIARKGFRSYIGCSDKSWGLCKWKNQYSAMHACKVTELPDEFTCERFGVYLDYEAGHLSFHELSDPIRHLHTFTTTFTEPLHAVFRLWIDSHPETWMLLNQIRPDDGY